MALFDVCQGDADGLCAALQWRHHDGRPARLITGLKRQLNLLAQVPAGPGDEVNVFNLPLDLNRAALEALLSRGVRVRYVDHHVGAVASHPLLDALVDPRPGVCSSLLVDRQLRGADRAWALVGAYGDQLGPVADRLASDSGLDATSAAALRRLGEAIDYNAHGDSEADIRMPPARLYTLMARHADPLKMLRREPVLAEMAALQRADLAHAQAQVRRWGRAAGTLHLLPDARWARRVLGAYANVVASAEPRRAHAVLRPHRLGGYVVSLRAPDGAHALCQAFGGGGCATSAGIDQLPQARLGDFIEALARGRWFGEASAVQVAG